MLILSLQLGHNASAGLLKDGKIIGLVSQEKFDYVKNSNAFPLEPINYLLSSNSLTPDQVDLVVISGLKVYPVQSSLSVSKQKKNMLSELWAYLDYKVPLLSSLIRSTLLKPSKLYNINRAKKEVKRRLSFLTNAKIIYAEHHMVHAHTPFYGFLGAKNKWTILTADGSGDYYSSTVSIGNKIIERIAKTPIFSSLGYIYSTTTQFLGMKALEHEYKVMGLSPYVKPKYGEPIYKKYFKPVIYLNKDGLTFSSKFPTSRFGIYLKENLCGERFDNIAYAVQKLTEDLILNWAKNAIRETEIPNIATSGGVFMNVKANMLLAYEESIKNIFFTPSSGDESNVIGAAYYAYISYLKKDPKSIKPIKQLYLGPSFTNEQIEQFILKNDLKRKYKIEYYSDIEGTIAELLAKGKIVARFSGATEFGARALGNRSILGDPSKMETFYKVNDQIKRRDFWMPFAPTMLKERANEYIDNPLNRDAPYMIVAFRSTKEGQKYFRAAMHQGDHTLRPQILEKSWNPKYYKIVKEFEKETGIGGVLNTSFNLHGYPIAAFPEQALHVFENSKLEYLALENYLIRK